MRDIVERETEKVKAVFSREKKKVTGKKTTRRERDKWMKWEQQRKKYTRGDTTEEQDSIKQCLLATVQVCHMIVQNKTM